MKRRDLLRGLGTVAAAGALSRPRIEEWSAPPPAQEPQGFPRKADFRIAEGYTYINGAYTHPMPIAAAEAYHKVVDRRGSLGFPGSPRPDPKAAFASLINAKPNEISFIPNTSTGENLVVECLGIRRHEGNVVTDALHFEGALIHLYELQKQGLDLRVGAFSFALPGAGFAPDLPSGWLFARGQTTDLVSRIIRMVRI